MSDTFEIYINDTPFEVKSNMPLPDILKLFGAQQPYVLLFNSSFLPSSKHESIQLKPDDHIEVISAIQGG